MKNFISINGRTIELTDEQVQQITDTGIIKKNPFERTERNKPYYWIDTMGGVEQTFEANFEVDALHYSRANYCTDKKMMKQRALHEILNRLLWRFSMENGGDEIDWNDESDKYYIYYSYPMNCFSFGVAQCGKTNESYFIDKTTAERAIEEIIKPFMAEHPEFVW